MKIALCVNSCQKSAAIEFDSQRSQSSVIERSHHDANESNKTKSPTASDFHPHYFGFPFTLTIRVQVLASARACLSALLATQHSRNLQSVNRKHSRLTDAVGRSVIGPPVQYSVSSLVHSSFGVEGGRRLSCLLLLSSVFFSFFLLRFSSVGWWPLETYVAAAAAHCWSKNWFLFLRVSTWRTVETNYPVSSAADKISYFRSLELSKVRYDWWWMENLCKLRKTENKEEWNMRKSIASIAWFPTEGALAWKLGWK